MATNSRFLFLTVLFLLLVSLLSFLVSASQLEDAHAGLIDGYTPAEIQRNAQRKSLGMPPIPPRALRKKNAKKNNKGFGRTKDGAGRAMGEWVCTQLLGLNLTSESMRTQRRLSLKKSKSKNHCLYNL